MKHAAAIYLVLIDDNPESFVAMHSLCCERAVWAVT
jgi:hypothetical protein